MSWVWVELTKIYGQLFVKQYGTHDNGTWLEVLKTLTPKALESGMERIRNLSGNGKFAEYPPNCLQFKALCQAFYDDLNLPSASIAYREIRNSVYKSDLNWSHSLIAYVAHKLPENFFLIEQEHVAYSIFKTIYHQVCDLLKQGHELPRVASTFSIKKTKNPEMARAYLSQIKQYIGA